MVSCVSSVDSRWVRRDEGGEGVWVGNVMLFLTHIYIEREIFIYVASVVGGAIVQSHAVSGMSTRKELANPFPRSVSGTESMPGTCRLLR